MGIDGMYALVATDVSLVRAPIERRILGKYAKYLAL